MRRCPNINVQHLIAMLLIDGTLSFDSIHDETRMHDLENSGAAAEDRAGTQRGVGARPAAAAGHRRRQDARMAACFQNAQSRFAERRIIR